MIFNNTANNLELLDMDTSESEHSDMDRTGDDSDWVMSRKRKAKKRKSKTEGSSGILLHPIDIDNSESLEMKPSSEETIDRVPKTATGVCCSCSKSSLCKTTRCECRAAGGSCGVSCGCAATKCSNRTKNLDYLPQSELAEGSDVAEMSRDLASQGATLLMSALSEKPVEEIDKNRPNRKPLADIGNAMVHLHSTLS